MQQKKFLSTRWQMFLVSGGMWFFLAAWSVSAFWGHIDQLAESYQNAAKVGALACEFALLALIAWHCFSKYLPVRRWSLILGFILAGTILVHSSALRGQHDAMNAQRQTEKRLVETMTNMSTEQAAGIGQANAKTVENRSQKERLFVAGKTNAQQGDIAKAAQERVVSAIVAGNDKIKDSSILPRWYLDGWCYGVLFILSLACHGIIFGLIMNGDPEDVDANFDGKPDVQQLAGKV